MNFLASDVIKVCAEPEFGNFLFFTKGSVPSSGFSAAVRPVRPGAFGRFATAVRLVRPVAFVRLAPRLLGLLRCRSPRSAAAAAAAATV